MLASDGASHDGIHKKVLGPNVEVHEAHRQVINVQKENIHIKTINI